jgi:hypothetical protein
MAITGAGLVGGTLRIYLNQWGDTPTKSFMASLDQKNFPPKPTNESMTLKQFTGRKFRDTEAECESLDTNTAKTSPE